MPEILHEVQMSASPAEILHALTTDAAPHTWWSAEAVAMRIIEDSPNGESDGPKGHLIDREGSPATLAFRCTDGPPDWIDTEITFDLAPRGDETIVRLAHRRWREPSLFLARCTTKWASFLMRLKVFVETPEPDDTRV